MLRVNVLSTLKSFLRPVGKQQPLFFLWRRARWLCGQAGGFNPILPWLLSMRNQRTKALWGFLLFFVEPVIYSCASHKVNPPSLSLSLSLREESGAAVVFTSIYQLFWVTQQQPVIIYNLKYLSYVLICCLLCSVVPASVYSPVVLTSLYVSAINPPQKRAEECPRSTHILPLHTFLVATRCYYLQPVQLDVSGLFHWNFFFFFFSSDTLRKHIRTFVTHSSLTPLSWITSTRPRMSLLFFSLSLSFFFFLSHFLPKQCDRSLLHHSSCTDVGRIPNFILILSACQFWKGEAGQKIIGRTSP